MKTLSTEQQIELQQFFQQLKDDNAYPALSLEGQGMINYWANELKPKRIRKAKVETENTA